MNKFNFKKIAMGLAISTVFSSCFVSNVVGMESVNFKKPSKTVCDTLLEAIETLISDINTKYDKENSTLNMTDSSYFNDRIHKINQSIAFLYQFKDDKREYGDLENQINSKVESLKNFREKTKFESHLDLHCLQVAFNGQIPEYKKIFGIAKNFWED